MEVKNGEKTWNVPGWVLVTTLTTALVTVGGIVTDICKVRIANHKQFEVRGSKLLGPLSFIFIVTTRKER